VARLGVHPFQRRTDHRRARVVEEVGEAGIILRPHRDAEFRRLDGERQVDGLNLHARIAEAEREGWLGDVEQLAVSLAATDDKIGQIDANGRRKSSPVFVGIPPISQLVVREAENRD
jgi:hypothetical protein